MSGGAPPGGLREEMRAVLAVAGERLGVPVGDAELVRLHSNATFALPGAGLLVRIATNPDAFERVAASVAVTRWLAGRGFACVSPADIDGQPWLIAGRVVSAWKYLPVVTDPPPTGRELGVLLRELHSQPPPPVRLRRLSDPFYSVAQALAEAPGAMPARERAWLSGRIERLRSQWAALEFELPPGLIHGDAHIGNLLRTAPGKAVLGDWDHVADGPREWDLIQIHYMRRRFGLATLADLEAFAASYGWDVQTWPGMQMLIASREITGLSPYIRHAGDSPARREELGYRLRTLREGDTAARWHLAAPGPGDRS